jgi:hypothetical protein
MALLKPSDSAGGLTFRNRVRDCAPSIPPLRCAAILFTLLAAHLWTPTASAQASPDEYQVKAAYLLNFARFVEWPADVLSPSAPLEIVIIGVDPFSGSLDEVLRGKSANGHPIHLRHQRWDEILTPYHIVFIAASEEQHLQAILVYLGRNVLTVSDIDHFSLRGGVIEFRMVGNRVRFDIDRTSADGAHLNISSKLLSVARAVHQGNARGIR